jgi:zinc transport system substrate-binding protein
VSPKLAQTVATEIGAETLVLNPIEGLTDAEIRDGKNYMSVMRENLIHLRRALVCQ